LSIAAHTPLQWLKLDAAAACVIRLNEDSTLSSGIFKKNSTSIIRFLVLSFFTVFRERPLTAVFSEHPQKAAAFFDTCRSGSKTELTPKTSFFAQLQHRGRALQRTPTAPLLFRWCGGA
jgi:hypothetical protein